MNGEHYGIHSDLLPAFLARPSSRAAVGARLLDREESRALESESLNRLPAGQRGGLDWTGVSPLRQELYEDEPDAAPLVRRIVAETVDAKPDLHQAVLFWGNLAVPTVTLPLTGLLNHLDDIVEAGPVFWIYLPAAGILVECTPDGQVTASVVPGDVPDGDSTDK